MFWSGVSVYCSFVALFGWFWRVMKLYNTFFERLKKQFTPQKMKFLGLFIHLHVQSQKYFLSCIEHKRSNFALCWSLFSMQLKEMGWSFDAFEAFEMQRHHKSIKKVVHTTCVIYSSVWGSNLTHYSWIILTTATWSLNHWELVHSSLWMNHSD